MSTETYKSTRASLQSTPTTIYTVPAATQAIVKVMNVENVAGAPQVVMIWQAGSANLNLILNPTTLSSGDRGDYDGAKTLATGETLVGQCSTNDGVVVGVELLEIS